jgi:hypothetical protein
MQKYYCDYIQEIETREGKQQPKLCIISDTRGMGQYKDCTLLFFFIDVDNGLSKLYCCITVRTTVIPLGTEKHITLK